MSKSRISVAALALLAIAILSISGCSGIASAPANSSSSSQQTTPGAATISVAPASISFGSVALGGTASQSVTITNGGGSNLTVTQVSTTASGVTITGISLPLAVGAGKQSTFNVVFSPKAAGALSGNVSVVSDASTSPSAVSLSGIGMAATAVLTPSTSSLSFGTVVVGKNSALTVTLTNSGNSDVTVSTVSVAGAAYSANGVSAGLILTPGQSATLDATFTPTGTGSLPGTVTVASSATNSPTTISLSGTGTGSQTVPPSVALSWTASTSVVAGYNVYRSQVSGGPYTKLDSSLVTADSYTDASVQPGVTYYYVVTSVTSTGVESADSTQTSASVPTS
ncbi:MAG TPA: choice-of-anchor D domain-containing protein [Candidatus Acidoferrales bacterium]|nr:choice-of-anchor D domain-containing protein [Candidatus Acidoferrales bacterium]